MKQLIKYTLTVVLIALIGISYLLIIYKAQQKPTEKISSTSAIPSSSSFISILKKISWNPYEESIRSKNQSSFIHYSSKLLTTLLPYLIMVPKIEINQSCSRPLPKFPSYLENNCTSLAKPRKVGVLLQFGFEADILEIHLHELSDIVDYFFILESTRSHFLGIQKPLIWEMLKHQKRFEQFANQTVHLVLDDIDTIKETIRVRTETERLYGGYFGMEWLQEKLRWLKFLQWNRATEYFRDDDILGIGDVDEIPCRDTIFYLKHCELPSDPVDIGIWYPYGNINQAHETDWPVPNHPHSLGDPSYWTLKTGLDYAPAQPTRNRGKSFGYVLGGMHMSHYGYLPVEIVEYFTATEAYADDVLKNLAPKLKNLSKESLRRIEVELGRVPKQFGHRIVSMDELKAWFPEEYKDVVRLPWFYDCNRKRYPTWEGEHDTRLD
ncbi:unnamed protein product [Orchesella dallaii]|uniref:Beta-1,4-mannosyl-glycoprotein 4-beta-N-acetylglucosaminyltransferase n=1 Tax=Orchesella dallaii TaxID=48710 RepID=A0ABP1RQY4_9HEXA